MLKYVKKIKGAADKYGVFNGTREQGFITFVLVHVVKFFLSGIC